MLQTSLSPPPPSPFSSFTGIRCMATTVEQELQWFKLSSVSTYTSLLDEWEKEVRWKQNQLLSARSALKLLLLALSIGFSPSHLSELFVVKGKRLSEQTISRTIDDALLQLHKSQSKVCLPSLFFVLCSSVSSILPSH